LEDEHRIGDEERRVMHLVPAPAVKLMKSRVLSRPGVKKVEIRTAPEERSDSSRNNLLICYLFIFIIF